MPPSRSTGSRSSATTRPTTSRRSVSPPTARTATRTDRRERADTKDDVTSEQGLKPTFRLVAGARHQRAGRHRSPGERGGQAARGEAGVRARRDSGDVAAAPPRPLRQLAAAGRAAPRSESPGELIDTNEWYLTLPTGKEGSPDTVEGSNLANYHSKFFDLTGKRDGIVFNASADGVTTKNSHYPRSELREMNGEREGLLVGHQGHARHGGRRGDHQAPDSKPEVVAVQIHDAEDDVMQIHLRARR